jgi:hypothetical protein
VRQVASPEGDISPNYVTSILGISIEYGTCALQTLGRHTLC